MQFGVGGCVMPTTSPLQYILDLAKAKRWLRIMRFGYKFLDLAKALAKEYETLEEALDSLA